MAISAPKSNDTNLSDLLFSIHKGETQLPDFQRKWTWDDNRIRSLLASLSQGYPMGALMQLEYGSSEVKFKYRTIEGAPSSEATPRYLVMDGQQRLTSMYRSLYGKDAVATTNDKRVAISRLYYLDMNTCLDPEADAVLGNTAQLFSQAVDMFAGCRNRIPGIKQVVNGTGKLKPFEQVAV